MPAACDPTQVSICVSFSGNYGTFQVYPIKGTIESSKTYSSTGLRRLSRTLSIVPSSPDTSLQPTLKHRTYNSHSILVVETLPAAVDISFIICS